MKRLYEKSELGFALVWIAVYCVGMSLFDGLSHAIGVESSASAVFALAVSAFLYDWVRCSGLAVKYGLCRPTVAARAFWFYLPLIAITLYNLWGGAAVHYTALGTVCYVVKMLCVGFMEELIFRGFLFRAMARDSVKWAAIVSGVTFGLGHILNLVNGSGMSLGENLVQIVSAVLIGLLFVVIVYRGGSLWPCIVSHGVFNALSAFSGAQPWYFVLILCVLVVAYTLLLLKTLPKREN